MPSPLLSADAAATRVGIKRATLYAYVSRGLLTAHRRTGHRGSWFNPVELDGLVRRARGPVERRPDVRVQSAVTLIESGRYWYRGESPDALASTRSFESVAELLWTGTEVPSPPAWPVDTASARHARRAMETLAASPSPTDRIRMVVTALGSHDPLRFDLRPEGAAATARRLVATTVAAISGRSRGSVAEKVAAWLGPRTPRPGTVKAIETSLIVMADHELAASTLAVRMAAAFKADPYSAVVAGLGPMAGAWHGAASGRVEAVLDDTAAHGAERAIGHVLGDAGHMPGFGHPLYPDGDPRVPTLLKLARKVGPQREADAVLKLAASRGIAPPNVDFALAALARALGLAPHSGEAIFTVGRLAGWLAHAIEEYRERSDFRLRALYTGPRPG